MSPSRTRKPHNSLDQFAATCWLIAAVYDRVSKASVRDRRRSIDQQHVENTDACQEFSYTIGERYSDPNISASRYTQKVRENWERLLADLMAGKFQVLVLWEASRGDRKLREWLGLLEECAKRGVLIHITSNHRTYDPSDDTDWGILVDEGKQSELESRRTSKRAKRDTSSSAIAGRPHGKVPYGYARVYDPDTGALVEQREHPEQAEIVREITRKVSESVSICSIVRDLNERGIPAPKGGRWPRESVHRVASNVTYIAKREWYDGELIDGDWAQLVDEATFYAAQRVLTDPSRKSTRPGSQKWLLSYLVRCDVCGEGMRAAPPRVKPKAGAYYNCHQNKCVTISLPWLDAAITDAVCRRLAMPDVYANVVQSSDAQVTQARVEMDKWQADLDGWRADAKAGKVERSFYLDIEADRLAKIAAAKARLTRPTLPVVARDLAETGKDAATPEARLADVLARWASYEISAKRDVIRSLCTIRIAPALPGKRVMAGDVERVRLEWLS